LNSVNTLLLRNARLVLPARIAEPATLLIEQGRITRIFETGAEAITADEVIDLEGLTVFPGFIDIHIHGAAGIDTLDADAGDLARVSEFLAQHGVTAWLPTLVPAPDEQYQAAIRAIDELMTQPGSHARALGVHYEGPFVNSEQCGALHREHFKTFKTAADLDALPRLQNDQARHMTTVAPEIEGGVALIKELKRRNWVVSIGHTKASVEVLNQALAAGARHMTHFMNAMTPLHHREVGAVGWGLVHHDVTCDIIADGVHINPDVLKLIIATKRAERVSLISDAIAAAGKGDGEYEIWGEQISVTNGRTQNAKGSIAGSVITMLDAVRMMLSLGVNEEAVARMASLNPARLLGIERECGSIEVSKRADLVALDEERKVQLTMIGGQLPKR